MLSRSSTAAWRSSASSVAGTSPNAWASLTITPATAPIEEAIRTRCEWDLGRREQAPRLLQDVFVLGVVALVVPHLAERGQLRT